MVAPRLMDAINYFQVEPRSLEVISPAQDLVRSLLKAITGCQNRASPSQEDSESTCSSHGPGSGGTQTNSKKGRILALVLVKKVKKVERDLNGYILRGGDSEPSS